MGEIQIYKPENQSLDQIDFIKSTSKQLKLREADSYELSKAFVHFTTETTMRLGIKEAVSKIDKTDIMELLLTKYKNLSFGEFMYAFKMERYGNLGERTQHFQLFNAEYVSQVIDKYVTWKQEKKRKHNISNEEVKTTITEKEKQFWINKGVTECIEYYAENHTIMDGKIYIYDVLYDEGYRPTDTKYKLRVKQDAVEVIEFEQNSIKPKTLAEKKQISGILNDIRKPKSGILINKCKEIVLLEFFRKVFRDEEQLNSLKEKYKN